MLCAAALCERWDGLSGFWGRRKGHAAASSSSDGHLKAPLLGGPGHCTCTGAAVNGCTCNGQERARAGDGPAREGSLLAQQGSGVRLGNGWTEQGHMRHPNGDSCEAATGKGGPSGPAALLHSDADRREFISAGAAAGLAVSHRRLAAALLLPVLGE